MNPTAAIAVALALSAHVPIPTPTWPSPSRAARCQEASDARRQTAPAPSQESSPTSAPATPGGQQAATPPPPCGSVPECYGRALGAYFRKDYGAMRDRLTRALEIEPGHAASTFELSGAYALLGERERAIELLGRVADLKLGFDPRASPNFAALAGAPEYAAVLRKFDAGDPPVKKSSVAAVVREKDLIPEGVAVDETTGTIYLGSLAKRKIVLIDKAGRARDFVAGGAASDWPVLGMKVDARRKLLWACRAANGATPDQDGAAGLFAYDLETGALRKQLTVPKSSGPHLFNDLAIVPSGEIFLTDSMAGAVYRAVPERDLLEELVARDTLIYPNGIAATPDGARLYVASEGRGISVVDVKTKTIRDLTTNGRMTLAGVDGLYLHRGSLVAVQNGIGLGRITRFRLDGSGERVERFEVLESRHPDYEIPTTGSVAGDSFVYIANSQLRKLGPNGAIADPAGLRDVVLLRLNL